MPLGIYQHHEPQNHADQPTGGEQPEARRDHLQHEQRKPEQHQEQPDVVERDDLKREERE